MTQHEISLNGEKEKIQFALELAIYEVTRKQREGQGGDENDDPNESRVQEKPDKRKTATVKKGHLGTNLLIKLPYVIGTPEFQQHPFAGVVFAGTNDEQTELFKEEQAQIEEDKKKEQ